MIRYDFAVCIGRSTADNIPEVKRLDSGVTFAVHLERCKKTSQWREQRIPYVIPAGTRAVFRASKPDKTSVVTDVGISFEGQNVVVCKAVEQAFTAAGLCSAEIVLFDPKGKRLTSATFSYEVTEECVSSTDTPSADYFDLLAVEIREANEAASMATAAAEKAITASVNPPKISADNTWLVWDFDSQKYIDTGIMAEGAKGDPGAVKYVVVTELPETDKDNAIYLVPIEESADGNLFDEYIYVDGAWEKIGSTSVAVNLDKYVKNTDYASENKGGVITVYKDGYHGLKMGSNGLLVVCRADEATIAKKRNEYKPIVPCHLDYAIKVGMTTNTETLNDDEKATACSWVGAVPAKTANRTSVYGVDASGNQIIIGTCVNAANNGMIPTYNSGGRIQSFAPVNNMDVANKAYVDGLVGDIETALDSIIAIQNSLIGGDGA